MQGAPRSLSTMLWVGCMLTAFTMTNLLPREPGRRLVDDKVLHFAGFLVLGLVTIRWLFNRAAQPTYRRALAGFTFLAAYAIIVEITQPLIGRSCELGDWLADLGGAACGVIAGSFFFRLSAAKK